MADLIKCRDVEPCQSCSFVTWHGEQCYPTSGDMFKTKPGTHWTFVLHFTLQYAATSCGSRSEEGEVRTQGPAMSCLGCAVLVLMVGQVAFHTHLSARLVISLAGVKSSMKRPGYQQMALCVPVS